MSEWVVKETDLTLSDGRRLHVYDTGADANATGGDGTGTGGTDGGGAGARVAVFWHHGTPNTGAPPEPLFPASGDCRIRWVSYDRPGYGPSTPRPGRNMASAAGDVAAIADALGLRQFAVMGHSSGCAYALACAALLPERVLAAACLAPPAPIDAGGLDWFAGMMPSGIAKLRTAARGRAALEEYLAATDFDPETFTPADHAALAGDWSWMAGVAGQAIAGPPDGMLDDELANAAPWGFDPGQVRAPLLIVHGERDRILPSSHGKWLAGRCPTAELWLRPDDGHISVLSSAAAALGWLRSHAAAPEPPVPEPAAPGSSPPKPLADYFDAWYADMTAAPVKDQIQQRHLGLPPHLLSTSLLGWDGIAEVTEALRLSAGETLLDLACGRGGYGLEIAARTGARLVGVDFSAEALRQAREHAARLGRQADFRLGDLAGTGLDPGSVDAVLCVDAIQFAAEPDAAYRELRRVLVPGGRAVLTCWEARDPGDNRVPERLRRVDLRAGLTGAGFADVEVRERPVWRESERAMWEEAAALDPGDDLALRSFHDEGVRSLVTFGLVGRVMATATAPCA